MTQFNCPKLQKSFEENKGSILKFSETLNRISDDIKNLENYLKKEAPKIPFALSNGLLWERYEMQGFRLLYELEGVVKPLIETPIEIRLKMYKALPKFMEGLKDFCSAEIEWEVEQKIRGHKPRPFT